MSISIRIAALILLSAVVARADEILLNDGSKIVGTLKQAANGKAVIQTDFAGELTIDMAKVKNLTTTKPMTVQLKSGERAVGVLTPAADGTQRVTAQGAQPRPIEVPQVTAVWSPDQDSPEVAALKAKAAAERWTYHVEAGITGQTGNTEAVNLNARAQAQMKTDEDLMRFYLLGRYSRNNGVASAQQFIFGFDLEHSYNPNLFSFANIELENNRFVNLAFRASAAAGVGYYFVRTDDLEFKVRGGPGFQYDSYYGGTSKSSASAQIGEFLMWKVSPMLTFQHSIQYYPTFDSLGDYRLVMENSGRIPISKDRAWTLNIGMRNEYVAQPQPGFSDLDTFYFFNVGLDF